MLTADLDRAEEYVAERERLRQGVATDAAPTLRALSASIRLADLEMV